VAARLLPAADLLVAAPGRMGLCEVPLPSRDAAACPSLDRTPSPLLRGLVAAGARCAEPLLLCACLAVGAPPPWLLLLRRVGAGTSLLVPPIPPLLRLAGNSDGEPAVALPTGAQAPLLRTMCWLGAAARLDAGLPELLVFLGRGAGATLGVGGAAVTGVAG
jgi:hypothetical protein